MNRIFNLELSPTLWRTCRVLAGATRLRLLRLVLAAPGATVTWLAEEAKISLSRASQELRRLQSRGLLRVARQGAFVRYAPEPDPLVPSARPLLAALKLTFALGKSAQDREIQRQATGLSHPRRLLLLGELLDGPRTIPMLQAALSIPDDAVYRHLRLLEQGGWVRMKSGVVHVTRSSHPLRRCLTDLVKSNR